MKIMKGRQNAHDIIRSSRISSRSIQIAATMDQQNKHEVATRGAAMGGGGRLPTESPHPNWPGAAAYRGLRHVTLRHHPHPFDPEGPFGWNPVTSGGRAAGGPRDGSHGGARDGGHGGSRDGGPRGSPGREHGGPRDGEHGGARDGGPRGTGGNGGTL